MTLGTYVLFMSIHKNYFSSVIGSIIQVLCLLKYGHYYPLHSGFGDLEVACWPLVPKFAGSYQAKAVGFFRAKKSSARLPLEGK